VGWHHHVTLDSLAHGFLPWNGSDAQTGGVGLTLWQLLDQLEVLLAYWAGACPVCKRPAPQWLRHAGRVRAPT
jgi:hypothetical protein